MEFIYDFLATVFGYIMNFIFIALDTIGLPYFWLCIILFAIISKLLTLPQKIGAARKKRLALTINYEQRKLRDSYGSIKKDDTERLKAYKKDTKAIFKKYKVSSGTGCLFMLLQFPIFVGLFRVVKSPFEYVPQFSSLTASEKVDINDFFGLSLESLPQDFGALGIIVPAVVLAASVLRVAPTLFNKGKKKQPAILIVNILQPLLITWMSFCFPIALSLYWTTKDIVNLVLSKIIDKALDNNEEIKKITAETNELLAAEKEAEEQEKARLAEEKEIQEKAEQTQSQSEPDNSHLSTQPSDSKIAEEGV